MSRRLEFTTLGRVTVKIEILPDPDALARQAASIFSRTFESAQHEHGRFLVVISGGSTPRKMNQVLTERSYQDRIDWARVFVFWSDERCVPPDHIDSNYRMACETLLDHVPIPDGNIHRIRGEWPAAPAAEEYEASLRTIFADQSPRFDLVILGLGLDGHTASLFPGAPGIGERERWVVPVKHEIPPPPIVDRVTLTPSILNEASRVLFLVSGSEKAERVRDAIHGPHDLMQLPCQAIKPSDGDILWLLDYEAAAGIR